MQLSDQHLIIKSSGDIQQICQPLFSATGIIYFGYCRYYKTGYSFGFQNNPSIQKYCLSSSTHEVPGRIASRLIPGQHFLSTNTFYSSLIGSLKMYFGTDNHFEIVSDCGEYFEILHFAGASGNFKILDIYLNNLHLLNNFKFYFLEKAKQLLNEASKPSNLLDARIGMKNFSKINSNEIKQALNYFKTNTQRYYIGPYKDQYLTKRELECLLYSLQGKNSVEIANELHISEKTVRSYLDLAKAKMEAPSKSELIKKAINIGLLNLT